MKSYTHLVKFLADLDYRQQSLKDKKNTLLRQRQALEEQFESALTDGVDYANIQVQIEAVDREIGMIDKGIGYYLNNPVPKSSRLTELCEAVIKEAQEEIATITGAYVKQADKTATARQAFMLEVMELGRLNKQASEISYKAEQATRHMDGQKVYVGMKCGDRFNECAMLNMETVKAAYEKATPVTAK
ncbi:MAG: hypothetical protein EOM37_14190 [Proteobacteria bacterium]|nr:hypothetical protein [Pseudomonadota bacterium]